MSVDGAFDALNLYLDASFAPGTLDPTQLGFGFGLDTDLDPGAGSCSSFVDSSTGLSRRIPRRFLNPVACFS